MNNPRYRSDGEYEVARDTGCKGGKARTRRIALVGGHQGARWTACTDILLMYPNNTTPCQVAPDAAQYAALQARTSSSCSRLGTRRYRASSERPPTKPHEHLCETRTTHMLRAVGTWRGRSQADGPHGCRQLAEVHSLESSVEGEDINEVRGEEDGAQGGTGASACRGVPFRLHRGLLRACPDGANSRIRTQCILHVRTCVGGGCGAGQLECRAHGKGGPIAA